MTECDTQMLPNALNAIFVYDMHLQQLSKGIVG